MKLYWSARSPFVRKVMVLAHEKGIASSLDLIPALVAMTQPNAELMKVNPLNKIPTLVTDDGRVLFDSDVISEYLDSVHPGSRMLPLEAGARWTALRWRAFGSELLDVLILWRNERSLAAAARSSALLDAFALKTQAALDFVERHADELSSAQLSVGHIAVGCALGYLDFRYPDLNWRSARPRVTAWFAEFGARPSFKATEPVDTH
jgi:glutathione S-transferase